MISKNYTYKQGWEYCFYEPDSESYLNYIQLPHSYDAKETAKLVVAEGNARDLDYPDEKSVWVRKDGETKWEQFVVYAEHVLTYKAVLK